MINLRGRVLNGKDGILEVELQESSEVCKNCHAHGLCGVDYKKKRIRAKNECNAQKNNMVIIKLNSNNPLKLAFIFYIAPLIIFFILYFLFVNFNTCPKYAFIYALAGFIVVYVGIYFASKNRRVYDRFLPAAIEKLKK
ncbi:MAG: SoxR reducing system RseC family protein [Candidatus Kappaea frigidicola]|nr:SoxR reducing system RseC family protein [Candidatus Kappaea frigidicola]